MVAKSVKVPNVNNTGEASLIPDPGTIVFNTELDALRYFNSLGNPVSLGNAVNIAQEVIVNAADGNDSNVGGPYATYGAARTYAAGIASPTNYVQITIIGDQNITGNFEISPYTVVDQGNTGIITASNNLVVSTAFYTITGALAIVKNCRFILSGIAIDWDIAEENALFLLDNLYITVPDLTIQGDVSTTTGSFTIINGTFNPIGSAFGTSFNVYDTSVFMANVLFNTTSPLVQATSTHSANLYLQNCGSFGSPSVVSTSSGLAQLSLQDCNPTTVTLTGTSTGLQSDVLSLTSVGLLGGATIAQVSYQTQADSLSVNPLSFTPTNYTATAPSSNIAVKSILSHLNGINTALGSVAASNIGITNDTTTNASMFPVWVTANTGSLPAKVSSTKLSFNPSTGLLNLSALTASYAVVTDGSKNLTSLQYTTTNTASTLVQRDASSYMYATGLTLSKAGGVIVSDYLTMSDTTQALNEKNWGIGVANTKFTFFTQPDSQASSTNWLEVLRSGNNITSMTFPLGDVFINSVTSSTSATTGALVVTGGVGVGGDIYSSGNIVANVAGKTFKIKQGSNACAGTGAVLVAGTVTVSTGAVLTGDIILLNCTAAGGTQGIVTTSINNGVSFTITSSSALDTSTYSWVIIKAA